MPRKKPEIVYQGTHVFCDKISCSYNENKQCKKDFISLDLHNQSAEWGSYKEETDVETSKNISTGNN